MKTNHCAKRDWVVASAGPSVMPFQRARRRQPAWAEPAPLPLYPRDTHCNEITVPTELFRAALSVSVIINMQISPGSKLPNLQQPSPSRIFHWLLCACDFRFPRPCQPNLPLISSYLPPGPFTHRFLGPHFLLNSCPHGHPSSLPLSCLPAAS